MARLRISTGRLIVTFLGRLHRLFRYSHLFLFIAGKSGKEYGIGFLKRLIITIRVLRSRGKYNPLPTWQEHLLIVGEILSLLKSLEKDVVECGCFDGSSVVSLSIAYAMKSKRLFVYDYFKGIPPPTFLASLASGMAARLPYGLGRPKVNLLVVSSLQQTSCYIIRDTRSWSQC